MFSDSVSYLVHDLQCCSPPIKYSTEYKSSSVSVFRDSIFSRKKFVNLLNIEMLRHEYIKCFPFLKLY